MQRADKSFPFSCSIIETSLEFRGMFGNRIWAELPHKEKSEILVIFLTARQIFVIKIGEINKLLIEKKELMILYDAVKLWRANENCLYCGH